MHAPQRPWLSNPYVVSVAFVALCLGDVAFAFGFYAFVDRGRGLYGSTVFTIIVAMLVFLCAAGCLLGGYAQYVDTSSAAASDSARVPKPTLAFLIFMTFTFVALDAWSWITDRFIPDPLSICVQFLYIGFFAVQYAYGKWRWRQSLAGHLPRTPEPLGAYAEPSVMLAIVLTVCWRDQRFLPSWTLAIIALLALGIGGGIVRAFLSFHSRRARFDDVIRWSGSLAAPLTFSRHRKPLRC